MNIALPYNVLSTWITFCIFNSAFSFPSFCEQPVLPSVMDRDDGKQILTEVLKTVKTPGGSTPSVVVFNGTVLVTESFLNKLMVPFKDVLQKKAEKVSN